MSQTDWRQQVTQRAIEISGGSPEEGDFNTAMIQLRHLVPANELALLQQDLQSVEPYDPSDDYDNEPQQTYWGDEYVEDCIECGAPPGWCDCA